MNNTISGGKYGMTLHYALNNLIAGNTLTGWHEFGLYQSYSNGNTVAGNTLSTVGGERAGAVLYHSSENQFQNNSVTNTGPLPGLLAFGSSQNNSIRSNRISSADAGIMLHTGSNGNIVAGNSIQAKEEAIVLLASSRNAVHHNNFAQGKPSYDDGDNRWDDDTTGNHWSNQAGANAVAIQPKGKDRHPQASAFPLSVLPVSDPPRVAEISLNSPELGQPLEVEDDKTIEGQTLSAGSVRVKAGGRLTLKNATLLIKGVTSGIRVEKGGTLFLEHSTIAPGRPWGGGYTFAALPGSKLEIRGSTIKGAGFLIGGEWQGLEVRTNDSVVEDSTFSDSAGGLFLDRGSRGHRVVGNTFVGGYRSVSLLYLSDVVVTNNRVERALRWGMEPASPTNSVVKDNQSIDVWYEKKNGEKETGVYLLAASVIVLFMLIAFVVVRAVKRVRGLVAARTAKT